jgi:glucose/arabinose dehydrogenase
VAGKLQPQPVLDLSSRVSNWTEQGLLGLAFHPTFGRMFVNFTDKKGDTRIVEFKLVDGRADPASERAILRVAQPYRNHNGGHLLFGPDGKLWVGLGDGGSHDDPEGNGQNPKTRLGKMLVIDVDAPEPKTWLVGLRNPWRYAFDRKTGDLFIADVGQDKWEEIDVVPREAALHGGVNLGWAIMEGLHCHRPAKDCKQQGLLLPVVEYGHQDGCSVTGGIVYRGKELPEFDGVYFYADYCTALIRGFKWVDGKVTEHYGYRSAFDPETKLSQVSSFGEDAQGELYILSLDGTIWKLVRR